jgi:ethanolamine utilization protein EutN
VIRRTNQENSDMLWGRVVGTAVSSIKHSSMNRQKLLIVQPLMADGRHPDGDPLVAVDSVGAGVGERVILTSDGRYARQWLDAPATPVRWAVIGIEDERDT